MAAASRTLVVVAALVALTVASYLAWLGWDQKKTRVPGTFDLEGPYEPWQVIGLAVTLAVVAVVVTLRYTASLAIVVIPLALTVVWSVDAASGRLPDANPVAHRSCVPSRRVACWHRSHLRNRH